MNNTDKRMPDINVSVAEFEMLLSATHPDRTTQIRECLTSTSALLSLRCYWVLLIQTEQQLHLSTTTLHICITWTIMTYYKCDHAEHTTAIMTLTCTHRTILITSSFILPASNCQPNTCHNCQLHTDIPAKYRHLFANLKITSCPGRTDLGRQALAALGVQSSLRSPACCMQPHAYSTAKHTDTVQLL